MSARPQRVHETQSASLPDESLPANRQPVVMARVESSSAIEKQVVDTINALAANGVALEDLAPIYRLLEAVRNQPWADETPQPLPDERRDPSSPASDEVLARASGVIDILIQAGFTSERAAQKVARQMVAKGARLPEQGGDARGWKRLLDWRDRLIQGRQADDALSEYLRFREMVQKIPAAERLQRVVDGQIWDQRQQ